VRCSQDYGKPSSVRTILLRKALAKKRKAKGGGANSGMEIPRVRVFPRVARAGVSR
jgi:hypothetical protein